MSHFNGTLMIFYIFFQYINSKERVFFYNKGIEVDFYVPDDGLAVQVSYSIDNPVTLEREVRAIRKHSTTSNTALPRMSSDEDAMTASNFPGSTKEDMKIVDEYFSKSHWNLNQVQDFIPLPMTMGCAMYCSEMSPEGEKIKVNKGLAERREQLEMLKRRRSGKYLPRSEERRQNR